MLATGTSVTMLQGFLVALMLPFIASSDCATREETLCNQVKAPLGNMTPIGPLNYPQAFTQAVLAGNCKYQGPVVQSIVNLTMSLRRQLVKYMPTKLSNPLLFFVEKM